MAANNNEPGVTEHKHGGLGQLASTAICGNDITSSCLYVSAIALVYAGRWAPVCLLLVAGTLWLFRSIYSEVVGALPLNGGAYNALLNTTSKFRASWAACLTILSYMATAVISSNEAMHYLEHLVPHLPIIWATIGLLAFFMILTIIGITESAVVAIVIFIVHLVSMGLLLVLGAIAVTRVGPDQLWTNITTHEQGGIMPALFFGFAAAMLGVSGFESSANFVEEQAEGVFPKTLRNMWIAVTVLNPGMAILALALVPLGEIDEHKVNLLSHMGSLASGDWLAWLISVDAVLVLSGATLTSYVGVTGLVQRMTLDRCLPQFLLKTTGRGTYHRIIIAFFVLAVSVLLITHGDLESLAAVYTLSFLSVMLLFAVGNVLLKIRRARLPRPERATWTAVTMAIIAVIVALIGNARLNSEYLVIFLDYLVPSLLIVSIMLMRVQLLRLVVFFTDEIRRKLRLEGREAIAEEDYDRAKRSFSAGRRFTAMNRVLHDMMRKITNQQLVFFTRGDNLPNLNQAMLYIRDNEHTNNVKVVTVIPQGEEPPPKLAEHLEFLDEAYPEMKIDFVVLHGRFTPEFVENLSKEWKIPRNLMFIGSPGDRFIYGLQNLGGVRLII
ncbi:MAG: APC family permease [Planctomycetes bacterium]|nr:APC family permease [Planctomycetota bacterium]